MTTPTQVTNLVIDRFVEKIKLEMQTNIPQNDPTRAKVVKKGLLQQAKVENNVAIGVIGGDHEDPAYRDGIITMKAAEKEMDQYFSAREIGGGQLWWRRGVCMIECFYIQQQFLESVAFDQAYAVLGRLMTCIETVKMTGIVDSYGERAIKAYCNQNTFFESGGPPNQYIFRGKVFWSVMTERA